MLTAQLTEIRRDLAQFPSAALQRACTAVDDARTLPWPRQLQLRRRLMLACGTKCGELEPEAFDRLMRRLRDSSAARAARTDDVAYLLHISKAGGSSLCAAAIKDARLRTIHPGGCNAQEKNSTFQYSPRWFANRHKPEPPHTCAELLAFAKARDLQLLANERAWDHTTDASLCAEARWRHVVVVRKPVERTLSHFAHLLRHHFAAVASLVLPLEDWVRAATANASLPAAILRPGIDAAVVLREHFIPFGTFPWNLLPGIASDYSTRQIAGNAVCGGGGDALCDPFAFSAAALRDTGALTKALDALEQYDTVLLLESSDEWPTALRDALGWATPAAMPHLRESPGGPTNGSLSPVVRLLQQHNRLDAALYAHARKLRRADAAFFAYTFKAPEQANVADHRQWVPPDHAPATCFKDGRDVPANAWAAAGVCVAADHGEGEEEEEVSRHDVIVTASSHNHRHALASFLEYFTRCGVGVRLVVYDLGGGSVGSGGGLEAMSDPRVEVRTFQYDRYPSWVRAEGGPRPAGEYAWKALIVQEVASEPEVQRVLWLDAGTRIPDAASAFRRLTRSRGLLSVPSAGPLRKFIRPEMLRRFGAEAMASEMSTLCNGAFIGLHTGSETALALLREWRACSLELECIAPGNSTRRDHRQDQAALTVLAWKHHVQGTCTRQIVSLIVHVEGVKVPCAAA